MYPVEFKVHVWNDVKGIEEINHGVTFADDYSEAAGKVDAYFGSDLISMQLFMLEESSCYIFENSEEELWHGMFKIGPVETYSGY